MKYFIYRITCKTIPTDFYIGSTINASRRKSHHKKNCRNKRGKLYWNKLYVFVRANGDWENFTFEVIETGEVENKDDIRRKEQEYIDSLQPTLNVCKAYKKDLKA